MIFGDAAPYSERIDKCDLLGRWRKCRGACQRRQTN